MDDLTSVANMLNKRIDRLSEKLDFIVEAFDGKVSINKTVEEAVCLSADTADALCETSIDVDERITTIEDALCELSKEG